MPGDYDGVGHDRAGRLPPVDGAVVRRSARRRPACSARSAAANLIDIPVPGDYDGVGHTELAVFRPVDGAVVRPAARRRRPHRPFGAAEPGRHPRAGRLRRGRPHRAGRLPARRPRSGSCSGPGGGRLLASFGDTSHVRHAVEAPVGSLADARPARPGVRVRSARRPARGRSCRRRVSRNGLAPAAARASRATSGPPRSCRSSRVAPARDAGVDASRSAGESLHRKTPGRRPRAARRRNADRGQSTLPANGSCRQRGDPGAVDLSVLPSSRPAGRRRRRVGGPWTRPSPVFAASPAAHLPHLLDAACMRISWRSSFSPGRVRSWPFLVDGDEADAHLVGGRLAPGDEPWGAGSGSGVARRVVEVGDDLDDRALGEVERLLEVVGVLPAEVPVGDLDRSWSRPSGKVTVISHVAAEQVHVRGDGVAPRRRPGRSRRP